jgi:acylphosphatase
MSQKTRFEATVKGRVQGVWFRNFTYNEARQLGLTGEVRNLPDGNVRVIAEGEKQALNALIKKLHEGPPLAHVREVNVNWENFLDQYNSFEVYY